MDLRVIANYQSALTVLYLVVVWLSGSALAFINVVTLRWARSILG